MVQSRAQLDNLKKGKDTQFTAGEKQARISQKGGKKKAENARIRKEWRTNIIEALNLPTKDGKTIPLSEIKSLSKEDIENANLTQQEKITVVMIRESLKGNVKAAEWLAKMIGENGTEKHELSGEITVKDDPKEIKRIEQLLKDDPDFKKKFFNEGKP